MSVTPDFPVMTGLHDSVATLAVAFTDCDAGCIFFRIAALAPDWRFSATHLADPFPNMITWLEAIADGAGCATWAIDAEGSVDRLTFLAAHRGFDNATSLLIHSCAWEGLYRVSACPISAEAVIAGFYNSFRTWVSSDAYVAGEWEYTGARDQEPPDERDEQAYARWYAQADDPWDGSQLRKLRSKRVERWLARQEESPSRRQIP